MVKFKGNPLSLVGIKINKIAPEFRVISQDMREVKFSDFQNKVKILSSFPSLDTTVCDLQVKEFNKRAVSFSKDIVVIGISMDLPFAQKRFCEMNNIKNIFIFSDYKYNSFGINFGLLIKELNLVARSVFIVDKNNYIRYSEVVNEMTEQPNYEKVIVEIEKVLKNPEVKEWEEIKCCDWKETGENYLKYFYFKDENSLYFLLKILSLIRIEKEINFSFSLKRNEVEVSINKKEFNIEIGNLFDRITY